MTKHRVWRPVKAINGSTPSAQTAKQGAAAAAVAGACPVLNLVLGPLDLDLLGLQVHLDRVVLNIIARRAPATCSATCCAPWPAVGTTPIHWVVC